MKKKVCVDGEDNLAGSTTEGLKAIAEKVKWLPEYII